MEKSYNKASICITSKIISAKEITSILKINPTVSHEKGTPLNPRVPNTIIRPESSWIVDSQTNEEEPLHIHIEELVSLIDKNIN
ncbi:MAG: DUF4279 domain-containing protein [Prochloraceae cyanobacterium]|nr:DUF4279 domain-containing protein [Prochloraceae cyanobacterium]